MVKTDCNAMKKNNYFSNREFTCGLVEVIDNTIKLNVDSEFLSISETGFTGIIPLDSGDDAVNVDKIRSAAGYFAQLAQDLRQTAKLYQSRNPETGTQVEAKVEAIPRNQQQQTEHLEKIHALLEQLPEEEKAIYQRFGFGERAKIYKMIDYETDPVKMQSIMCTMIKNISERKDYQA